MWRTHIDERRADAVTKERPPTTGMADDEILTVVVGAGELCRGCRHR